MKITPLSFDQNGISVDRIKISIKSIDDLDKLHKAVESYIDLGYVSEDRVMSDGETWWEILVKE